MMNERNLEKMELDFTAKTYENMCQLSEIKINKYSGPDNFANIASALPAMGLMNQGIQKR